MDRARSWCEMIDVKYHRFSPTLSSNVELDESDDRLLLAMLCDTRKFVLKNLDEIMKLGKELLGET